VRTAALARIERTNLILAVAATCLSGLLWGGRGMLAAGVGGALACANFWVLRRVGARAAARAEEGATGPAVALALALVIKMSVLFVLVWVAVRVLGLPALPFSLGLSVFVVSILMIGLSTGGAEAEV
jgi:ATP synthase I chain